MFIRRTRFLCVDVAILSLPSITIVSMRLLIPQISLVLSKPVLNRHCFALMTIPLSVWNLSWLLSSLRLSLSTVFWSNFMSQILRLFSLYDSAVSAYLKPFWSDHKANALRSFTQLVNDRSSPDNMVANHPDQFVLFELGTFSSDTGVFTSHPSPLSLGGGHEFLQAKV